MLDVLCFEYELKKYIFDAYNYNILKIDELEYEIIQNYYLTSKEIVKRFKDKYATRDIIKGLDAVKYLLETEVVQEEPLSDLIFDYSNLFNIKTIYYSELNNNVKNKFEKLIRTSYDKDIQLVKVDYNKRFKKLKICTDNTLYRIEEFLEKWKDKCNFFMNDSEYSSYISYIKSILAESKKHITEYINTFQSEKMENMKELIKRLIYGERTVFPCSHVLTTRYINSSGNIYLCSNYDNEYVTNENKNNVIFSVYEREPCVECKDRYICGGYCNLEKNRIIERCDAFILTMIFFKQLIIELKENYPDLINLIKMGEHDV